jgi:prepilin-type processing-associated H-X9-DG protein
MNGCLMNETPNSNRLRQVCIYAGFAAFAAAAFILYRGVLSLQPPRDLSRPETINCVNNLKQIGLSAKMWALDHGDQFPFNLSTNVGGTAELCARGPDGFDTNAFLHFQVLSNEVITPLILVCPRDRARKPAANFAHFRPENATYMLRSGTNVTDLHPQEVLARCPVDGNTLFCDGSVQGTSPEPTTGLFTDIHDLLASNPQFCVAAVLALLGCVLLLCGFRLGSKTRS